MLFQQVSHGAIQFTAYEELRKVIIDLKSRKSAKKSGSCDAVLVGCYLLLARFFLYEIDILLNILGSLTLLLYSAGKLLYRFL